MENSMQPLARSEQDKSVPLDTSGEPVDIEIKEDENKELVEEKLEKEDTQKEEVKEEVKDEAEEYSTNVKKRIDKLTFKLREAERQKEEALKFAESQKKQVSDLRSKVQKVDEGYLDQYQKRVSTEMEKAQNVLQNAINAGDAKAQVESQKAIARLAIEEERASASIKLREDNKEKLNSQGTNKPENQPLQQAKPDPKAEAWAEKNSWFGANEAMTFTALSIHKKLLQEEGFDGKSDEYYKELDKRIRLEFPHKFEKKDEDKDKSNRVVQTVASANRSSNSGRRTVRLTPSQVAIAKKLGVPLEEYAKHVKEA
jgi:hypothetical protein